MIWDSKTIIDDVTEEYNLYQLPSFGDDEEIPFESLRECSKEELQNLFFQFSQQKIYIEEIKGNGLHYVTILTIVYSRASQSQKN